ncbi:MAG: ABC transporter ATP-binding protein [Chitinophagales bacterium]|nr:ABC transporter ATP-binding protein [Chitinophagales bacterium]MDW8274233.1 ABC transporter ATP-binding protein [Chitinophagales bacterium]
MGDIALKVEGISKMYRLGVTGADTLAEDLQIMWKRLLGKGDILSKIDENDRSVKGTSSYVWALREISFEILKGDVLGVVGKNGAGKSTLLKILSRVTTPTTGKVRAKGRIASLLEVGTGFHPELTGRDNIYLNGAILGMTRAEIKSKFDEIVEFSGVERYIDTPVKRYSSGMYVRLAFAVAAHLEPEILIVDEVLAVGDAEFQKKCLGKMNEVSKKQGRTVLFVSHNMGAVQELCNKAMLLQNGRMTEFAETNKVITSYLNSFRNQQTNYDLREHQNREGNKKIWFTGYELLNERNERVDSFLCGQSGKIVLHFEVNIPDNINTLHFSIRVSDDMDKNIFHMSNSVANGLEFKIDDKTMRGKAICTFENLPVQPGLYYLHFFVSDLRTVFDHVHYAGKLEVESGNFFGTGKLPPTGILLVKNHWNLKTEEAL